MLLIEGIILGHNIFFVGMTIDLAKIEIIHKSPVPSNQREVRSFLDYEGYYHWFIEKFSKIALPLFNFLLKILNFIGILNPTLLLKSLKKNYPQHHC